MVDLERLKDAYWEVVIDSLVAFHGYSLMTARTRAAGLRDRICEDASGAAEPDIIYHAEPFHVASDLAGARLSLADHRQEYSQILEQRFGGARHATVPIPSVAHA
jgi:hypothetical protein